jgi:hypothetical protein
MRVSRQPHAYAALSPRKGLKVPIKLCELQTRFRHLEKRSLSYPSQEMNNDFRLVKPVA